METHVSSTHSSSARTLSTSRANISIDLQSKKLELLGLEKDELCAQIARIKELLSGQRKILDAMPGSDRTLLKAFQVFILDVVDALRGEEYTERAMSLSASVPEVVAGSRRCLTSQG